MGVRFLGNVTIPTLIIGKGKGRFATIFILSANANGTVYRQNINDGAITWSDSLESSVPIAIDGNAYDNYSYVVYQNKKVKKIDIRGTVLWEALVDEIPNDLALGSNNKLYVSQEDGTISIYDIETGDKDQDITIDNVSNITAKYGVHVGTSSGYVHYVDNDGLIQHSVNTSNPIIKIINTKDGSALSLSTNKLSKISNEGGLTWSYTDNTYGTFKSFTYDPFDGFTYVGTTSGNIIKLNSSGQYVNHYDISNSDMTAISFWYDTIYVADSTGKISAYDEGFTEKWAREGNEISKVDLHVTQSQETIHPPIKAINKGTFSGVVTKPQIQKLTSIIENYSENDYESQLYKSEIDVSIDSEFKTKPTAKSGYDMVQHYSDLSSEYYESISQVSVDVSKDIEVKSKPQINNSYTLNVNYTNETQEYNDQLSVTEFDLNTANQYQSKPVINQSYKLNINYTQE